MPVDHEIHLLTSQVFSHRHALLGYKSLYTLDAGKLLKLTAVKQLRLTAPVSFFDFASLSGEVVQPI